MIGFKLYLFIVFTLSFIDAHPHICTFQPASYFRQKNLCAGRKSSHGVSVLHRTSASLPLRHSRRTRLQSDRGVHIRDWKEGEGDQILALLSSAKFEGYDPEGPLRVDCGSEATIKESYYGDDECGDGCMLVATTGNDSNKIVGTAALIIGTPIAYLESGASISSPEKVTGAVRRVCTSDDVTSSIVTRESILRSLLLEIESRAAKWGATELIVLAYPISDNRRPSATLLDGMGYQELPASLDGLDALQYCKVLGPSSDVNPNTSTGSLTKSTDDNMMNIPIGATFIAVLLAAFIGVGNLMGLELIPMSDDNRGAGSPLSVQELEWLRQDEKMKRTDIDGQERSGGTRQWEDLTFEEQREEAALMKIIQGQNVRMQ